MRRLRMIVAALGVLFGGAICADVAAADQLKPQQIQLIQDTASSICTTVTQAKGEKTDTQIKAEVQAQLNGLAGKFANIGGTGSGSITTRKFEGLTQQATAEAMIGDRGCRERVFNKMFDKLSQDDSNIRTKAITIRAVDFSAHSPNILEARTTPWAGYGDVIMTDPNSSSPVGFAEWLATAATSGWYHLEVEYAAKDRRPLTISINKIIVVEEALGAPTGDWIPDKQRWTNVGEFRLEEGTNIIRFEGPVFPHIRTLRFFP